MLNTRIIQAAPVLRSGCPPRRALSSYQAARQAMDGVAATVLQACSMDWWQGLSDEDQRQWAQHADSEQPRHAYACYLTHEHDRLLRTLCRIEAVGKELNRLTDT